MALVGKRHKFADRLQDVCADAPGGERIILGDKFPDFGDVPCSARVKLKALVVSHFGGRRLRSSSSRRRKLSKKVSPSIGLTDDLVTQEMASGRAELLWSTFVRVQETPHLFLFYGQKHLAHPVPKRAFASEQEIVGFRELIRRQVREVSLRGQCTSISKYKSSPDNSTGKAGCSIC
jgi:YcxB-like protein